MLVAHLSFGVSDGGVGDGGGFDVLFRFPSGVGVGCNGVGIIGLLRCSGCGSIITGDVDDIQLQTSK